MNFPNPPCASTSAHAAIIIAGPWYNRTDYGLTPPFALSALQRKVAVQWCQSEFQEARLEKGESQVRMDPPARREDGLLPQQPPSEATILQTHRGKWSD